MQRNNLTKETIDNTQKLWEEKPLTDDEIQDNVYNAIKNFIIVKDIMILMFTP
jgi:hypothetical protein